MSRTLPHTLHKITFNFIKKGGCLFYQLLRCQRTSSSVVIASLVLAMRDTSAAQSVNDEETSAKYQTAYNWQKHPSFSSPHAGLNSLGSAVDKMHTFSTTAHWGTRLWQGDELYFNPEIASGVPFSNNLLGLGGFSNGKRHGRQAGPQRLTFSVYLFAKLGTTASEVKKSTLISTR